MVTAHVLGLAIFATALCDRGTATLTDDTEAKQQEALDSCIAEKMADLNCTTPPDESITGTNCSRPWSMEDNDIEERMWLEECYRGEVCVPDANMTIGNEILFGACAIDCYRQVYDLNSEIEYRPCDLTTTPSPESNFSTVDPCANSSTYDSGCPDEWTTPTPEVLALHFRDASNMDTWDNSESLVAIQAALAADPYNVDGTWVVGVTADPSLRKLDVLIENPFNQPDLAQQTTSLLQNTTSVIRITIDGVSYSGTWYDPYSTTLSPTPAPTDRPTAAPTARPTVSTDAPSSAPSPAPSSTPTGQPTIAPTSPTVAPTKPPSDSPTPAPSDLPTTTAVGPSMVLVFGNYPHNNPGDETTAELKTGIRSTIVSATTLNEADIFQINIAVGNRRVRQTRRSTSRLTATVVLVASVSADTAEAAIHELEQSGTVFEDPTSQVPLELTEIGIGNALRRVQTSSPTPAPTTASPTRISGSFPPTATPTAGGSTDLQTTQDADDSDDGMVALGIVLALVFILLVGATVWVQRNYRVPSRIAKAEPLSEASEGLLGEDSAPDSTETSDPYKLATTADPLQTNTNGPQPVYGKPVQETTFQKSNDELLLEVADVAEGDTYSSQVQLRQASGSANTANRMSNVGVLSFQASPSPTEPLIPEIAALETISSPTSAAPPLQIVGVTTSTSTSSPPVMKLDDVTEGESSASPTTGAPLKLKDVGGETNIDSMKVDQAKSALLKDSGEKFVLQEGTLERNAGHSSSLV